MIFHLYKLWVVSCTAIGTLFGLTSPVLLVVWSFLELIK